MVENKGNDKDNQKDSHNKVSHKKQMTMIKTTMTKTTSMTKKKTLIFRLF